MVKINKYTGIPMWDDEESDMPNALREAWNDCFESASDSEKIEFLRREITGIESQLHCISLMLGQLGDICGRKKTTRRK